MTSRDYTARRSSTSRGRQFLLLLLLTTAGAVAFNHPGVSQQKSMRSGEVTPRGQREVSDVIYGDWQKLCFMPGGAQQLCRTSISGTFSTGQLAIRLDIIERGVGGASRLQVFSPVGMYLQNPVKLTIDQGETYRVPYTWCLTNTCVAAAVAEPPLLEEMMVGRILRLEFVDSNLLSLVASLPLSRFAPAYKGQPAQTFEQDIDE
jgi:invasion protein IalB